MGIKRKGGSNQPESLALKPDDQNKFTKKVKKIQSEYKDGSKPGRGVIYLGHIPHGFYEFEMKSYFSQFGDVTRLKLARSRKTGRSKGYAFIEFEDAEVAQIAAESMNNYLMFEKLLKCEVVPPEKVHPTTFHCGYLPHRINPNHYVKAIACHNSMKSDEKQRKLVKKTISKQKRKLAKLAELGIKLDLNNIIKSDDNIKKVDVKTIKEKKTISKKTIPEKITTPKGDLMVLAEDESETEITFKTPPNSVRSSKLTASGKRKKSNSDTPRSRKSEKTKEVTKIEPLDLDIEASARDDVTVTPTIAEAAGGEKPAAKDEKERKSPKTAQPGSSKKTKKAPGTPQTPENKPARMATRSSTRKTMLASKTKLKTPPSGRKRL